MRSLYLALSAGGALALGVTFALTFATTRATPAPPTPDRASSTVPVTRASGGVMAVLPAPPPGPAVGRAPGCAFALEETLTYDLSLSSRAEVDPVKLGFQGTKASPDLVPMSRKSHVVIDLRARDVDPSGTVFIAQYRDLRGDGIEALPDLDQPFLLRIDRRCTITGFARLRRVVPGRARVVQAIAYELSWRWPEEKTTTYPGEDTFGPYTATSVFTEDAGGPLVQRRIDAYTDMGGQRVLPSLSLTSVRVGSGSWFESLTSDEDLAAPGVATNGTRTQAVVTRVATPDRVLNGVPLDLTEYVWEDELAHARPRLDSTFASHVSSPRDNRERLAAMKLTVEQATSAYNERVKAKDNFAESWRPLARFLEAHPEKTDAVVTAMKRGVITNDALPGAFLALGGAATSQARDALVGIASDKRAPSIDRTRSLFALAPRTDLDIGFARSLRASVGAIANGATRSDRFLGRESALALGMMAGVHGDDGLKDLASSAASEILSTGKTVNGLSPGFEVIANIGDAQYLPMVEPFTESPAWEVRQAAAIAVRRMPPRDTEAFTAGWLARETNPNVKRSIYATVEGQTLDAQASAGESVIPLAIHDLQAKPDVLTRKSIIRILGLSKTSPDARRALIAQVHVEQELRSDLYGQIAKYLSHDEIKESLGR